MKSIVKRIIERIVSIRHQESAQREFMRAVYRNNLLSHDYEKPAYMRCGRHVQWSQSVR